MDQFMEALLCEKTDYIPEEYDWFAPLIGDWDFDYYDEKESLRHVKGEWIFRRILEGAGVEDIFICPSRDTRNSNPQPDSEYGVALRIFNDRKKCYNMVYACDKYMERLEFKYEDGRIVGTVIDCKTSKWVFSDITDTTFLWQNVTVLADGTWKVNSTVCASRKNKPSQP